MFDVKKTNSSNGLMASLTKKPSNQSIELEVMDRNSCRIATASPDQPQPADLLVNKGSQTQSNNVPGKS